MNLGQDYVGAISSGSRPAVVRVAFTDRCGEVKWEMLNYRVSEPDVDLGFISVLKRIHVELLVVFIQRDSQVGMIPEKKWSRMVGSLRMMGSYHRVKTGDSSLGRWGDRPQST